LPATFGWVAKTFPTSVFVGLRARCAPSRLSCAERGYEAEVKERGAGLSVGQKQLIHLLARWRLIRQY